MDNNKEKDKALVEVNNHMKSRGERKLAILHGPSEQKTKIDAPESDNMKKIYAGGIIVALLMGGFLYMNKTTEVPKGRQTFIAEDTVNQAPVSKAPYMETAGEQTIISEAAEKELAEITETQPVENVEPDTITYEETQFHLFDSVLLPVSKADWARFDMQGENYSVISEFYPLGENPNSWTQKFVIHKVASEDKNTFAFADKLVNGVIVNYSEQASADGKDFTKDDISFNYAQKSPSNTMLYWGRLSADADESQFIRVFLGEYTGEMYIATLTYKLPINSLGQDMISEALRELNSAQELKPR